MAEPALGDAALQPPAKFLELRIHRLDLEPRGGSGGGSVSVTTALAVLPTNRPMAASKLTDHSSDAES